MEHQNPEIEKTKKYIKRNNRRKGRKEKMKEKRERGQSVREDARVIGLLLWVAPKKRRLPDLYTDPSGHKNIF